MTSDATRNPNLDRRSPSIAAQGAERWRTNLGRDEIRFPRDASWWTGRSPADPGCPGRRPDGTVTSLSTPNLATCTRAEVQAYFENTWVLTEILFAGLAAEEAFFRPPYHNLRHPFIFYYTHPPALYVNKLRVAGLVERPLNALFEGLFETGVDEMSWDDLSKNEMEWPSISECRAYRRQVFELVSGVIAGHPGLAAGHPPIGPASPLWALFMGFEHERIHLETSSVLIRELPIELVRRPVEFPRLHPTARIVGADGSPEWKNPQAGRDYPPNPLVEVPAGKASIGKEISFPSYGWDNEYGSRVPDVAPFAATRHLITNGEFHEFVAAGGYREDRWWSEEGRRWKAFRNVKWPTFWVPCGPQGSHQYLLRTTFELVEMPWDWPVACNWHEAKACCAWRTEKEGRRAPLRLLTEAEHVRLRAAAGLVPAGGLAGGEDAWRVLGLDELNIGLRHGSESPVDSSKRPFGDLFGNVWHWCEDHFHPLEGFRIHPYYDDFSTPCFDGKHLMILGGSFISTGDEATVHARFHFRPHFFQHAGFRIVDPLRDGNDGAVVHIEEQGGKGSDAEGAWESTLFAAFAPAAELLPRGVSVASLHRERLPERIRHWTDALKLHRDRALDVGCGPGGIAYALAAMYREVIGADLSAAAIEGARRALGSASFAVSPGEGGPVLEVTVERERAARLSFRQTDASSLPAEYAHFDLVLLSGVLTRLPSPKSCLGRMGGARGLVRPGGLLVVADAFRWDPKVTPRELWLDPAGLASLLRPDFEFLEEMETFAVERPEPARTVVDALHASIWRRRA